MICYIILHYKNDKVTIDCVNSLKEMLCESDSKIIIVDNGSNNGSYERLCDSYSNDKSVKLVASSENLGFAKGNNLGYVEAKRMYSPDIMVVCNNDLLFEQKEFENKLIELYNNRHFDILGPDIINLDDEHQNPHRSRLLTIKEIKKMNFRKRIFLIYLRIKKIFPFLQGIQILEKKYDSGKNVEKISSDSPDRIVIQGSCVIVGGNYIANEDELFCPDTFLYFEEDLLSLKCYRKGYKVEVSDDIYVKHLEGKSTKVGGKDVDRRYFMMKNMLVSGKIYERNMREDK